MPTGRTAALDLRTSLDLRRFAQPGQSLWSRIRDGIPEGRALPEEVWRHRHLAIVSLLYVHAFAFAAFAVLRGYDPRHAGVEAAPILAAALVASIARIGRTARSCTTTLGLVASSAILVHLSGGTIEAHFHFFVILGVISLYQTWAPFLLAIGFVVLHHGVVGVLDPVAVYNHPAAVAQPWRWAAIHGGMVLAASVAQLATWRFAEAARARSQLLLDSAADGIFGVDRAGQITFTNPAGARMLGSEVARLEGRQIDEVVGLDSREALRGCIVAALEGRASELVPLLFRRGDQSFPGEASCVPVRERRRITGAVVTFRDVTDRHRSDAELHTTLSLLTATLESTADGILVVDAAGRITSLNHKFVEMWRLPDDVVASRDDDRALASVLEQVKDPEEFLAKVRELYAQPEAESFDTLHFKDGRVFERYSKPQLVGGEPVGRVWSFRDVTERSRLDEMKNSFLSAVSHELRTPLTSVVGYAVTLRSRHDELDPDATVDLLDRLQWSARKLERLIGEMLDLDRLSRGIVEPRRIQTDVGDLVRRVVAECDAFLARPVTIDAGTVWAAIDPPKVERIVENLITNAHRHTPEGSPVHIAIRADGAWVEIAVDDEGEGVPDDLKASVFEPFKQGGSIAPHSPGVGIGLSLVTRFAELHGGRAWVQDRAGGGASFRVSLPRAAP